MFDATRHLRKLREKAGLSMDELAKAMGYARASSIQRYEKTGEFTKEYFSIDFTQKLADVLIGQGTPVITRDEIWALALPDARREYLRKERQEQKENAKQPYDEQAALAKNNKHNLAKNYSYGMAERESDEILPLLTEHNANGRMAGKVNFQKKHLIPVYGQAVAGINGEFEFNGNVVFEVLCPPQLSEVVGAYAVQISGESMWPRYRDGELVYCDPIRRVKKGDFVVAQIMVDEFSSAPQAFVKMFVRHNFKELVLEQFNPRIELTFPHQRVVSVHYIALAGDAL